eukprot:TRINITY_DN2637_c0_g6_i1.p1 TRINITY_DN2637_c0_g6~~TRINITY_DN2637_c0_g6_i1.p1  ORF type:complete len:300 (-),score=69.31 TRINITY_DN2637_c0_g6_i1:192-1091(-)
MQNIFPIVKGSFIAIFSTFIYGIIGFLLAKSKVFDQMAGKVLSKLIYSFMLPSFVLINISEHFTIANLSRFWALPAFYFINLIVGMLIGKLVVMIVKPKERFKKSAIICSAVSNNSSIPLQIAQVLFFDQGPLSNLENSKNTLAYISFYIVISELVIWILVKKYLSEPKQEEKSLFESNIESETNNQELQVTEEEEEKKSKIKECLIELKTTFFTTPVILALLGIFIGLISLIRSLLFGENAPLSFVKQIITNAGAGTIPVLLLTLGISFSTIQFSKEKIVVEKKIIFSFKISSYSSFF